MAKAPQEETPEVDPLQQALGPSDVEAFVDKYKIQLLLGFIGIIVVISLAFILQATNLERQTELAHAFTSAETIEELETVATKYKGTVAAGNALIRKAALLEEEGKRDDAQSTLVGFITNYPDHPRKDQALLVLGRLAEGEEKWGLARSYYQQVDLDSEVIGYAKLHLGDILMQEGKYEEAETYYKNIQSELTGTDWFVDLRSRIDMAGKKVKAAKNPVMPMMPEPAPEAAAAEESAKPEPAKPAEMEEAAKPAEGEEAAKPEEAATEAKPEPESEAAKPEAEAEGESADAQPDEEAASEEAEAPAPENS